MTTTKAHEILRQHNLWRRGSDDVPPTDPTLLGQAIDAVCSPTRTEQGMRNCYAKFLEYYPWRLSEFPNFDTWILSDSEDAVKFRQGWAARGSLSDQNPINETSLILRDPSELPEYDGEILVALWGANEWEIVNVRENEGGPFTAEYKNSGEPADPEEWQWWADLRNLDYSKP